MLFSGTKLSSRCREGGAAEIDELRKRKEEKNKTFGICFHHDAQEIKEPKEGTIGEWKRIDINGNDLSFSNMSERWPFNAIKEVVVDGQKMIRIPKIYVRNTVLPSSSKYAGERQWSISNKKIDSNWHVHPAFMHNGKEYQYVDIAKYIASKGSDGKPCSVDVKDTEFWTDISFDDAHNTAEKRNVKNGSPEQNGWHMYNIYEHHLLARLMLIEYGTSNLQTVMTGKKDGMNATYHGITNVWGYFSTWQNYRRIWLDGLLLRWGNSFSHNGEAWGCYIFQAMDYKNPGGHYVDIAEYNFAEGGNVSTYLMNPLNGISNSVDRGDIFLEDYNSDVWYNRGHDDLRKRIDFHGLQDVSERSCPMPLEKISVYSTSPKDTLLGLEMGGPFTLMRHFLYYHGADDKTAFRLAHYVE